MRTVGSCAWVHLGTIASNLHIAWKTALFHTPTLALGSILANFSSIIPVFLAWHCAFHAPASFDAAGTSLPRWRLALAQEAERWYLLRPFFAWHLCISRLLPSRLHVSKLFLVDFDKSMRSVTEFRRFTRNFFLKVHCFMRCSIKDELPCLYCGFFPIAIIGIRVQQFNV